MVVWNEGEEAPEFIWRDDKYSDAFMLEMRKRRGIFEMEDTDDIVRMRMATTEDFECVIESIRVRFVDSDTMEGKGNRS